ncbi:MAG: RiPP maturation radical SAM C-methyltransferase [Desulfopila sp.]
MAIHPSSSDIALIAMPWSLFNRPSIQLGGLKAYLEHTTNFTVDSFHPYLGAAKILGMETYAYLSKNSWAGEALYSAILFPEQMETTRQIFIKSCDGNTKIRGQFDNLTEKLHRHLLSWSETMAVSNYTLIGFSVCFSQLLASLAAASIFKDKAPSTPIVFGGSSCSGGMGRSLLSAFDQVDYVIEGEGEESLRDLMLTLQHSAATAESPVTTKDGAADTLLTCRGAALDLNTLPPPNYDSYFEQLADLFPGMPFNPKLPVEFSRGCWWNKCSFCNLNLQWCGYRRKTADSMVEEIKHLLKNYQCLDFCFCDNSLPLRQTDCFFEDMRELPIDLRFFAEVRSLSDQERLAQYRSGGLTDIQVGIESLANSLLKKMEKGTTVMENLATMKYCAENDITLNGNLITEFPGTTKDEIEATLINLDYALPFAPLAPATFFLGKGSPMEKDPGHYGIDAVTRHNNSRLFPDDIVSQLDMLIKDYRGDKTMQKRQWRPVRHKMRQWREFHAGRDDPSIPALRYRDGGTFLVIRQERLDEAPLLHRLRGTSRQLYLFCTTIRTLEEIAANFSRLTEQAILDFFHDLSKKRLVYRENDSFLALAIRNR